ncbi:MAG: hypothetical protein RQ739_11060 [Desulfotignum sp.]|nr:hypothetical protein [Desulfotignum sp.]
MSLIKSVSIHKKAIVYLFSEKLNSETWRAPAPSSNRTAVDWRPSGIRVVYAKEMILPVAEVMKEIGYQSTIVLHGTVGDSGLGMDEASVCGKTHCARIRTDAETRRGTINPVSLSLPCVQETGESRFPCSLTTAWITGRSLAEIFRFLMTNASMYGYIPK